MLLIRYCEEAIISEYPNDLIKMPVHLSIGEEGILSIITHCLKGLNPIYYGTYRSHGLYLSTSEDEEAFFDEMFCTKDSQSKGRAGSMHLFHKASNLILTSAVVGTTIPLAVGHALAIKQKGEEGIVICILGDGACEEGTFYESLNFASLHKLPILFLCTDNELAIHTHTSERKGYSIKKLVESFELDYHSFEIRELDRLFKFCNNLRLNNSLIKNPIFLHTRYFRMLQHVGTAEDFKIGYRERPKDLINLDPINIWKDLRREVDFKSIEQEVRTKISSSLEKVKSKALVPATSWNEWSFTKAHDNE